jgi:hypothetical protein
MPALAACDTVGLASWDVPPIDVRRSACYGFGHVLRMKSPPGHAIPETTTSSPGAADCLLLGIGAE